MADKKQLNPALKFALDLGPLLLFFAANARFGIFAATGVFMAAALAAVAVTYAITRHLALMRKSRSRVAVAGATFQTDRFVPSEAWRDARRLLDQARTGGERR